MKLLLENGAQPKFEDEKGQTPLSRAVEKGGEGVVKSYFLRMELGRAIRRYHKLIPKQSLR